MTSTGGAEDTLIGLARTPGRRHHADRCSRAIGSLGVRGVTSLRGSSRSCRWQRAIVGVVIGTLLHSTTLAGCIRYRAAPLDTVPFQERAIVQERDGLRVSASALGSEEAHTLFGVSLAKLGIQPVWIRIANDTDDAYLFFQQTVDPDYYAAAEAAYKSHYSGIKRALGLGLAAILLWPIVLVAPIQLVSAQIANRRMDALFASRAIGNHYVSPGHTIEGFVFTPVDEGTKNVPVTLLGPEGTQAFSLFVQVPGGRADHISVDFEALHAGESIRDLDNGTVSAIASTLPCCATNARGTRNGDPLNVVIAGTFEQVLNGLTRAGWDETDALDITSSLRTAGAFLFASHYRYAPISNLFLYERAQDVAFQKARETIHERNHMRLWLSPLRLNGLPVWVGQVSRDIGIRFTPRTWTLTTHAIDPNVDDAREALVGDLLQTGRVAAVGYLAGSEGSTPEDPARNLTGDRYHTDGYLALTILADQPTAPEILYEDAGKEAEIVPPVGTAPETAE